MEIRASKEEITIYNLIAIKGILTIEALAL